MYTRIIFQIPVSFLENELPWLRQFDTKLIANLCGSTIEDYVEVAEILGNKLDMFELNISCPNVKEGGMAFGTDAKLSLIHISEPTRP